MSAPGRAESSAQHRRAKGLAATSLAWGFWAVKSAITQHLTAEQIARMKRAGIRSISAEQGIALFDAALQRPEASLAPAPFDRASLAARNDLPPVLRGLPGVSTNANPRKLKESPK